MTETALIDAAFSSMARSESFENPSTDLNSEAGWESLFGTYASSETGIKVSDEVAATCSTIWRGVNLIANTVAKLPCYVLNKNEEHELSHPVYRLINDRAAPEYSAFHFQQTLTLHAILRGNGYAWINRQDGRVKEMLILNPRDTYPTRERGQLYYATTVGGQFQLLYPEDVLHIHGMSFDGLQGRGIVSLATDDIGTDVAHRKVDARWFRNPTPPFTLNTDGALSDAAYARMKADWHKVKSSLSEAHRPAILEEGVKANPLVLTPSELQAIEQKKFRLTVFANWLGLPPHKLGAEGKSAYASLEQENQSLRDDTYDPWLVVWEDELKEKLLKPSERAAGIGIRYDRDELDRVNSDALSKRLSAMLGGAPYGTRNEARKKAGLPRDSSPDANRVIWPANIKPVDPNAPTDGNNNSTSGGQP